MKFYFFLPILLLTACSTPGFSPNRFLTPEARGKKWSGDVVGSVSQVVGIRAAEKVGTYPNETMDTSPSTYSFFEPQQNGNIGLTDSIDLYLTYSLGAGFVPGVKYQFAGSPASNSKAGNFSASIGGGLYIGSVANTGHDSPYTTNVSYSGYELMILLGYRIIDPVLVYANPFWTHLVANVTTASNSSLNNLSTNTNGSGDFYGVTLGGRYIWKITFNGELSLLQAGWKRTNPTELAATNSIYALLGLGIGYQW